MVTIAWEITVVTYGSYDILYSYVSTLDATQFCTYNGYCCWLCMVSDYLYRRTVLTDELYGYNLLSSSFCCFDGMASGQLTQ
jgi:hypothetical protein